MKRSLNNIPAADLSEQQCRRLKTPDALSVAVYMCCASTDIRQVATNQRGETQCGGGLDACLRRCAI